MVRGDIYGECGDHQEQPNVLEQSCRSVVRNDGASGMGRAFPDGGRAAYVRRRLG